MALRDATYQLRCGKIGLRTICVALDGFILGLPLCELPWVVSVETTLIQAHT